MVYPNDEIPPDAVLTVEEGVAYKQRVHSADAPVWRWMGNYRDVYAAAATANVEPACGAGAIMFQINPNDTVATWLWF